MITKSENNTIAFTADLFDIGQTLTCGQCFRFTENGGVYTIKAFGKTINIKQHGNRFELSPATPQDFRSIWEPYFDLTADYAEIQHKLSADPVMRRAIDFAPGIRILQQEKWETLISFIISQNNNIPRIKSIIERLCEKYGDGAFPSPDALCAAGVDRLSSCGTGFRSKYIHDASSRVLSGEIDLDALKTLPASEIKETLKKIKGVGDKVADCVILFAYKKTDAFPIDVWVKKIMEHFYFNGEPVRIEEIRAKAHALFGEYGGYAQQYLFHYARNCLKASSAASKE